MFLKEGLRSKCSGPAAKAGRRRGRAGNKRRVFAYRFFSTTSWVSQMTSHPRFCFYPVSYSEAGWEDWIKLKIYPPVISFCLLRFNTESGFFHSLMQSGVVWLSHWRSVLTHTWLQKEHYGVSQEASVTCLLWASITGIWGSLPPWASVPLLATWGVSSARKLCAPIRQDQFPVSVALESEPPLFALYLPACYDSKLNHSWKCLEN